MLEYRKKLKNIGKAYMVLSLVCMIFSIVYEAMSHGVYSNFMLLAFLFPLLGGVVPFVALLATHRMIPLSDAALTLYHSGVITLMLGSLFEGVVYIYGTTSSLGRVFWIAGGLLTAVGLIGSLYKAVTGMENDRVEVISLPAQMGHTANQMDNYF